MGRALLPRVGCKSQFGGKKEEGPSTNKHKQQPIEQTNNKRRRISGLRKMHRSSGRTRCISFQILHQQRKRRSSFFQLQIHFFGFSRLRHPTACISISESTRHHSAPLNHHKVDKSPWPYDYRCNISNLETYALHPRFLEAKRRQQQAKILFASHHMCAATSSRRFYSSAELRPG